MKRLTAILLAFGGSLLAIEARSARVMADGSYELDPIIAKKRHSSELDRVTDGALERFEKEWDERALHNADDVINVDRGINTWDNDVFYSDSFRDFMYPEDDDMEGAGEYLWRIGRHGFEDELKNDPCYGEFYKWIRTLGRPFRVKYGDVKSHDPMHVKLDEAEEARKEGILGVDMSEKADKIEFDAGIDIDPLHLNKSVELYAKIETSNGLRGKLSGYSNGDGRISLDHSLGKTPYFVGADLLMEDLASYDGNSLRAGIETRNYRLALGVNVGNGDNRYVVTYSTHLDNVVDFARRFFRRKNKHNEDIALANPRYRR